MSVLKTINRRSGLFYLTLTTVLILSLFLKISSHAEGTLLFNFPLDQNSAFDSTNTVSDSDISLLGDYQFVAGYQNSALDTTTGGYLEINDSAGNYDFSATDSQFSVDAWVKSDSFANNGYQRVVGKMSTALDENTWLLGIDDSGGIYCAVWDGNGDQHAIASGVDNETYLTNGQWNHLACSWDGQTDDLKAYIDNVLVATKNDGDLNLPASTGYLGVGAQPKYDGENHWGEQSFPGYIDEVSLYSGVVNYSGETATPTPTSEPTPTPTPSLSLSDVSYQKSYVVNSENNTLTLSLTEGSSITQLSTRNTDSVDNPWYDCYDCRIDGNCPEVQNTFECDLDPIADEQLATYQLRAGDGTNYTDPDFFDVRANLSTNFQAWIPFNLNSGTLFSAVDGTTDLGVSYSDTAPTIIEGGSGGSALHFDGTTNFYMTDSSGVFDLYDVDSDKFKIRMLIRPESGDSGRQTALIDNGQQWYFGLDSNEHLYGWVTTDIGESIHVTGSQALQNNVWQWVTYSWDPQNKILSVQIDGQDNPDYSLGLIKAGLKPVNDNVYVAGGGDDKFIGDIDDLMIFRGGFDVMPPVVSFTALEHEDRYTDNTPTYHLTVTDSSGVSGLKYFFNQGRYLPEGEDESYITWQTASADDGQWGGTTEEVTITPDNPLADGTWYLFARATDTYGNQNYLEDTSLSNGTLTYSRATSPSVMAYYRLVIEAVDTTAPRIYSQAIMTDPSVDTNPIIRGYVKDYLNLNEGDTISNIASIQYRLNGGDWQTATAQDGSFDSPLEEYSFSFSQLLPGDYTYEIRSVDFSGNDTNDQPEGSSTANYQSEFTIVAKTVSNQAEEITKEEDFTTHGNQDLVFTDGVWGNGLARLKQSMSYSTEVVFSPDNLNDIFGAEYGTSNIKIKPSLDGNIWILGNNSHLYYFNKTTNETTDYGSLASDKTLNFSEFLEYSVGTSRKLIISYEYGPTLLYDLGSTPENTSDDTSYSYSNKSSFSYYERFRPFAVDTRGDTTAIWATVNSGDESAQNAAYIRVDTKNTDDISDDTYVVWQNTDINPSITVNDFTGSYFDQSRQLFIAASYSTGVNVCTDSGTPEDKTDDSCYLLNSGSAPLYVFSITKDTNGIYWLGGDQGISYLNTNDTIDTSDDTLQNLVARSNIGNDIVADISWEEGEFPTGNEIWYITTSGRLRGLNYNSSYSDTLDDTSFNYLIPNYFLRSDTPRTLIRQGDEFWIPAQGIGLQKISLTRDYATSGRIEFLPSPLDNMLAIDHINLENVIGDVSNGSSYTFNDLASFEVSNDSGLTWYPIVQGQTVHFSNSDYRLKLRINLEHGSTPVVQYLRLAYVAGTDQESVNELAGYIPITSTPSTSDSSPSYTTIHSAPTCGNSLPASAPTLLSSHLQNDGSVLFYFSDAQGEVTNYHLIYGTVSGTYQYGAVNIATKGQGTFTVKDLKPNTTYYFRLLPVNVCAVCMASNELSVRSRFDLKDQISELFTPVSSTDISDTSAGDYQVVQEATSSGQTTQQAITADGYDVTIDVLIDGQSQAGKSIHLGDLETVTDNEGRATFTGVVQGTYDVKIYSDGEVYSTQVTTSGTNRKLAYNLKFTKKLEPLAYLSRYRWFFLAGLLILIVVLFIVLNKNKQSSRR